MRVEASNIIGTTTLLLMVALCAYTLNQVIFYSALLPDTSVANISLDVFGMLICMIIFAATLIDHRINISTILFMFFLSLELLLLFWDVQNWIVDGNVDKIRFNKVANYYIYGLVLIIIGTFWLYLKELYRNERVRMRKLSRFIYAVFAVGMLLIVTNPFTELYFTIDPVTGLYTRSSTFFISYIIAYSMVAIEAACIIRFESKPRRKAVLLGYLVIPFFVAIAQFLCYGISLQYVSMMFAIVMMYANLYIDRSAELIVNETAMTQQRAAVMISQIQPHFLYNCLTSIMNIKGNPPEARDAVADFGKYMRANLDSMTQMNPIPVSREIDQVESYIALRRLKFGDMLNVRYDVEDTGFFIPPMSIKIIVEAAIKYNLEIGNQPMSIGIYTASNQRNHVVCISNSIPTSDSMDFIGNAGNPEIMALSARIKNMVGGHIDNSISPDGTITCTITIPRGKGAEQ